MRCLGETLGSIKVNAMHHSFFATSALRQAISHTDRKWPLNLKQNLLKYAVLSLTPCTYFCIHGCCFSNRRKGLLHDMDNTFTLPWLLSTHVFQSNQHDQSGWRIVLDKKTSTKKDLKCLIGKPSTSKLASHYIPLAWMDYLQQCALHLSRPSIKLRIDSQLLLNLKYNSLGRLRGAESKIEELKRENQSGQRSNLN